MISAVVPGATDPRSRPVSGEIASVIFSGEEGTEWQLHESDPGLSLVGICFLCEKDSVSPACLHSLHTASEPPPGLVRLPVKTAGLGWAGKEAFGSMTQPDGWPVTPG